MIDDDEWPQADWIDQFLKTAHATSADVLQGSILFGYGEAADGHGDIRRPTGPVAMLQGAGNLLIRRAVLEEMQAPWFDPAFRPCRAARTATSLCAWNGPASASPGPTKPAPMAMCPKPAPIWAGCCAGPIRSAIPTCWFF